MSHEVRAAEKIDQADFQRDSLQGRANRVYRGNRLPM
jgi:hypothetical protein